VRRASFLLGFLLIFANIFSGCSPPKQTETETQVTSIITSVITTTTAVPTLTSLTTSTTSTYTKPPVTSPTLTTSKPPTTKTTTTTTTTTPEVTVDLSNVALIGTGEGFNIIDGQGLSGLRGGISEALDGVVDADGKLWYVSSGSIITYDGKSWGTMWRPQGVYTLYAITIRVAGFGSGILRV
jgi:hypothetical protein